MRLVVIAVTCAATAVGPGVAQVSPDSPQIQARLDAAASGAIVELPAGTWDGDLTIRKPVTLRGAGRNATNLSGSRPVSIESPGVTLEGLTIRGRADGIAVRPQAVVRVHDVEVESPTVAIRVGVGGSARVEDTVIRCTHGGLGTAGLQVDAGQLTGARLTIAGPCRRGVDVSAADVSLSAVSVHDATEAGVRCVDSKLVIQDLEARTTAREAAGVFGARCAIKADRLQLTGGEEGILIRGGHTDVKGLTASGMTSTGFAAVGGTATIGHATFTGPFSEAAISALTASELSISDSAVESAGALGLLAVHAHVDVRRVRVQGTRAERSGDFGHGFALEKSTASLQDVEVTHAEGAAIYASDALSRIKLDGCVATDVEAGVVAVLEASVEVRRMTVTSTGVGVLASGGARVTVNDSSIRAPVGVMACAGATVKQGRSVVTDAPEQTRTCLDAQLEHDWREAVRRDGGPGP